MEKIISTFYPFAVIKHQEIVLFVYAIKYNLKARLFLSKSADGITFADKHEIVIFSQEGKRENLFTCEKVSFFIEGKYSYITYQVQIGKKKKTLIAKSVDMITFTVLDGECDLPENFSIVTNHKYKKNFLAYGGEGDICAAGSDDLLNWHATCELLSSRKTYFDAGKLAIVGTAVVDHGIFVLYKSKNTKKLSNVKIGGALFSFDKPYTPYWRSEVPILEEDIKQNRYPERFLGSAIVDQSLYIYWASSSNDFFVKNIDLTSADLVRPHEIRQLKRHPANPILKPKQENKWEMDATFNPAALFLDGKVHLLYRAIGEHGVSVLGYASSDNGFLIDERLDNPVYQLGPSFSEIKNDALPKSEYVSGGSWAGCEDPRITHIGNRIYMTYVLFDGYNPPGVALTSISVSDFLTKNWKWKKPIFISKPGEIQKNWMLFPQKINGKYAILHSITPKISIEYVDKIHDESLVIESMKMPGEDAHRWDNIVRGAGAPPLKTKYGWLVLYHAMDKKDPNKYKVGAMILDHDDPTKILYRCKHPILEPNAVYENHGAKSGVVYVCGAVIKDNMLLVYYGGADSVVCVATENLDEFLEDMVRHVAITESKPTLLKIINSIK
jgi:predicted GH43/DUF377 family glycosyl hydrolase